MIEPIDINNIKNGQQASMLYCAEYGNNILTKYIMALVEKRTVDSDKLVLHYIDYIIRYYSVYKNSLTYPETQNLLLSITKTVTFLSNQELLNDEPNAPRFLQQYDNKTGEFLNRNIFRDLKFIQKLCLPEPKSLHETKPYKLLTKGEVKNVFQDIITYVSPIVSTELSDDRAQIEKCRKLYQTMTKPSYDHIYSIAAYYRECQRIETVAKYLTSAINVLNSANNEPLSDNQKIFVTLKALEVTGEFCHLQNISLCTRSAFDSNIVDDLKAIGNIVAHPERYFANKDDVVDTLKTGYQNIRSTLQTLRSKFSVKYVELKKMQDDQTARLKYYKSDKATSNIYNFDGTVINDIKITLEKYQYAKSDAELLNKERLPLYMKFKSMAPDLISDLENLVTNNGTIPQSSFLTEEQFVTFPHDVIEFINGHYSIIYTDGQPPRGYLIRLHQIDGLNDAILTIKQHKWLCIPNNMYGNEQHGPELTPEEFQLASANFLQYLCATPANLAAFSQHLIDLSNFYKSLDAISSHEKVALLEFYLEALSPAIETQDDESMQAFKMLRNGRHFQDILDATLVQFPKAEMLLHYALKHIKQFADNPILPYNTTFDIDNASDTKLSISNDDNCETKSDISDDSTDSERGFWATKKPAEDRGDDTDRSSIGTNDEWWDY